MLEKQRSQQAQNSSKAHSSLVPSSCRTELTEIEAECSHNILHADFSDQGVVNLSVSPSGSQLNESRKGQQSNKEQAKEEEKQVAYAVLNLEGDVHETNQPRQVPTHTAVTSRPPVKRKS